MMKEKALMTLVVLLCTVAQGVWAQDGPVPPMFRYIERSWDVDQQKVVDTEKYTTDYTYLQGDNPDAWLAIGSNDDQDDHYYVVVGNTHATYQTLKVYGKAHIIICDGATLTCTGGIKVEEENNNAHLFIHGQKNDTGKLIVTNSYTDAAGIGSAAAIKSGAITIYGGDLDIEGGKHGAGIGSGGTSKYTKAQTGLIEIYGGKVNAQGGEYAAGIGGGCASDGGELHLYGGEVTATGGHRGAGVGGGGRSYAYDDQLGGYCGSVHIYTCKLTAQGGDYGAGIGTGMHAVTSSADNELNVYCAGAVVTATGGLGAAGIGGGRQTSGILTHIYAGTVRATGGNYSAGIGGGNKDGTTYGYGGDTYIMGGTVIAIMGGYSNARSSTGGSAIGCADGPSDKDNEDNAGKLVFGDNMRVTGGDAEDNIERVFTSAERDPACRWRNYVKIEECTHETPTIGSDLTEAISYTLYDDVYHTKQCRYCKYSVQEEHSSSTNCDYCSWKDYTPLPKDGDGTFLINTLDDWTAFCSNVNNGSYNYSGKTVKLKVDITSSTIVGTEEYSFAGTFDGDGHTLTANISSTSTAAPFYKVDGATIEKLIVAGNVETIIAEGADHSAGLIAKTAGTVTINNVRVSATVKGYTYYGGFIGHGGSSTINMTGCVFDGELTENTDGSTQFAGGFIGWGDNMTVTMTNCLFAGTSGSGKKNFHPVGYYCKYNNVHVTPALTEVYYTVAPSAQVEENNGVALSNGEKQVYSITTTDPNVTTLEFNGAATSEYTVSGLKCYATGIAFGTTLYACGDATVSLTLAHVDAPEYPYFKRYKVSGGGSLDNATTNTPTLNMSAANQTISTKYEITLYEKQDNSEVLEAANGKVYDVWLYGRTFYKDGHWNTLCLPFDVTIVDDGLTLNAIAMTLNGTTSSFDATTGVLTLNFDNVEAGNTIAAGTPFIVKWTKGVTVTNAIFIGVTVSSTTPGSVETKDGKASFVGNYSPVPLTANDKTVLYLGADDKLYYPNADMTIYSFRAYFQLNGITAGELAQGAIVLNFGDGETTEILSTTNRTNYTNSDAWYDLNGHKLNGKPSRAGIYINNGKKIVVK